MIIHTHSSYPPYPVGSDMKGALVFINKYIEAFKKLNYPLDTEINIWCRGSSGAILSAMFSILSGHVCYICHVKKEGENSHQSGIGHYSSDSLDIILDDQVASGRTIEAILQSAKENGRTPEVLLAHMAEYRFKDKFLHIITN